MKFQTLCLIAGVATQACAYHPKAAARDVSAQAGAARKAAQSYDISERVSARLTPAGAGTVITQSVTTGAAQADAAALCPAGQGYPAQFEWDPNETIDQPLSATMGTPRIEHYRNGQLVAVYKSFANGPGCIEKGDGSDKIDPGPAAASGCGPFNRTHSYTLLAPNDSLIVYPASYTGEENNPWIGATFDSDTNYADGIFTPPVNVTVTGFVTDGVRPAIYLNAGAAYNTFNQAPLYIGPSKGFVWDNVDVLSGPNASVGKAGVYVEGATDPTLSNMRVSGFGLNQNGDGGANGVFGADGNVGTLTLQHVELDRNGGSNGPAHNAYIGASTADPHFRVIFDHSWSHNARYGHDFKSRAPRTTITASYLEGGLPLAGQSLAESYNLDDPNGGILVVKRSVLVKNRSGDGANGINLAYGMEGIPDKRPRRIDIENNLFVTFASTYDGTHTIFPLSFFYPQLLPGSPGFPVDNVTIANNAFVGYCPTGNAALDYRGSLAVIAGFSELNSDFSLAPTARFVPASSDVTGHATYGHAAGQGTRRTLPTIGAMD